MSSHAGPQVDRKGLQQLDKKEIEKLFQTWKKDGDAACREKIICQHLYLVQAVARKFTGLGESAEDLTSEGMMGLINAVDLFDPKRGVQFATYATHLIDGQIRHYLRDKSKLIREPAWIQERLTRIARTAEAITQEKGKPATLSQIAKAVDLTEKQVRDALKAQQRSRVASLDTSRSRDSDDGEFKFEAERLLAPLAGEEGLDVEDRLFLEQAMERLKPLEQKVLHHFYYLDLNQTEIARKIGISVNYASYLLRGALAKLRKAFEAQTKVSLQTSPSGIFERRCEGASALYSVTPQSPQAEAAPSKSPEVYFSQAISQEVLRARRYPQQFAILYLEPDNIADLDSDEIERAMQGLILRARKAVRMVDVVARLDQRKVGLLLPHTGRQATVVAERLKQQSAAGLSLSIGLAVFPHDGSDEASLEERCLQALVQAQQSGGDQVCRLDPATLAKCKKPKSSKKNNGQKK